MATSDPRVRFLIYYFGIPGLFGVLLGANHAGLAAYLPLPKAILFWVFLSCWAWLMNDIGTRALATLPVTRRMPLAALLFGGLLLGTALSAPGVEWRLRLFTAAAPAEAVQRAMATGPWWTASYLEFVARYLLVGTVLWVGVNFLLHRILGWERYGHAPAPVSAALNERNSAAVGTAIPGDVVGAATASFFAQIPERLGRTVLAVQAQEHYIRVITTSGAGLIMYRFSDAVRELRGTAGAQVHRSFWVARSAIAEVKRTGQKLEIILSNAERIPVSRSFIVSARAHGLLDPHNPAVAALVGHHQRGNA